ncbi:MAG TPA: methyltransferase domain-containing protein [Chromatiaceae bacterium]|nr:methyltransferase domain-containing protein [Chromatiaceae bacterium]
MSEPSALPSQNDIMDRQQDDIVARQYEAWVYPPPIHDMVDAITQGYYEYADIQAGGPIFWPRRRDFNDLDILIAGCGTNQAAYTALRNPSSRVVAIDISQSSLSHSQYLKDKHGLDNLEVRHLDLMAVASLDKSFDFILSTGVLHHLKEPDRGLQALRGVLRPAGVMHLMLYGKTLRQGVYLLQEAFRLMGLGQSKEDIDIVRKTLTALPGRHSVHAYLNAKDAAEELKYDTAIVDTFLHGRDRAYSITEIFDFVEENGLAFLGWMDRLDCSGQANFPANDAISKRIKRLDERKRAAIIDLLAYTHGVHRFNLCHPEYLQSLPKIDFEGTEFLHYVPRPHSRLKVSWTRPANPDSPAILEREWHLMPISHHQALLIEHANGRNTIAEILGVLDGQSMTDEEKLHLARQTFATLYDMGHLLFSVF